MINLYFIIIITTLAFSWVVTLISEILNIKRLKGDLPKTMEGVYDGDKYLKSQLYTRERTLFGLIKGSIQLAGFLVFWFMGGYNFLDMKIRVLGYSPLVTGLMYIGILTLASTLILMPFSIYSTFVIEEKYGFNKTSPKTFLLDRLKGLLLAVLLGGIIVGGILWFFQFAGEFGWLYAWIAISLFMVIMQAIAPAVIMPLFNKFKPMEQGQLKDEIDSFSKKADFPMGGIFVVDGSRRSSKSNAFFSGFGKTRRIALFDTLINNQSIPEVVAVLAHEIGHYKKGHILKSLVVSIFETGITFWLLSLFMGSRGLFDAFRMEQLSVYGSILFFGMLYSPVSLVLSPFFLFWSRKNEYEADRFAVDNLKEPKAMVLALKKLSVDNLSNLTPHPFYVFLNYSHPPLLKRVAAINKRISSLNKT
jgi:STE24 endopeptidase